MDIGIDIGTSYSSVAVLEGGKAVPIKPGKETVYSIPSAVYADGKALIIGRLAEVNRRLDPSCFKANFKKDFGTEEPYILGDMKVRPEQIYTEYYRFFKESAQQYTGEAVDRAYLTHPAGYGKEKKELLKHAAQYAGLFHVELLPEPVAAGKSFFSDRELTEGEKLLVYDFGGGTFDTALLKMEREGLQLLGEPMGMDWGGIAFDRMLYRYIVDKLPKDREIQDAVKRPKFQWMIMEQTVEIKHLLSSCDNATVNIPIGFGDFIECRVSREEFIQMISSRVRESMDIVKKMLSKSDMDIKDVDKILCVGGTSRIPYITEELERQAGKTVLKSVDPELAVCCGAALGGRVDVRQDETPQKDATAPQDETPQKDATARQDETPQKDKTVRQDETPQKDATAPQDEMSQKDKTARQDETAPQYEAPLEDMSALEADLARHYKDAPAWYRKAAVYDEKAAWFNLGNLYRLGAGVQIDYMMAAKWLKKAATVGDVQAQRILGRVYDLGGHGLAQNYQKAMYWYKKGALLGDGVCQNNVGKMYEKGQGVKKDYKEALWWYRKAEKQNQETALLNLGNMYRTGRGVAIDYVEAVRCYEKSAKAGCLDAYCNLGWIYEQGGNGIAQDYLKAFYYYKKGAEQGNAICQNNLGKLYEYGRGVHKNIANAKMWYQKAMDHGYQKAQCSLQRL